MPDRRIPVELDPRSTHGFGLAEDLVPEGYVEIELDDASVLADQQRWLTRWRTRRLR